MSTPSRPVRVRRITAGLALVGCGLAGLVAALVDADEGTDTTGTALYDIAAAHSQGIWVSGLLMILSALFTMPSAMALLHLSSGRGVGLGQVGVVFLVVGGLGHMGYGTWQLMVARMPEGGERASLAAYFDETTVIHALLVPMMMGIILGLILCSVAAYRSGNLTAFAPAALVAAAIYDTVVQFTSLSDNKWVPAVSWLLALVGLGAVALTVLGMSDRQWAALYPRETVAAPDVAAPAGAR